MKPQLSKLTSVMRCFSKFTGVVFALLLLSHCATKHQTLEFSPYFASQPEGSFNTDALLEIQRLEAEPLLVPLQKKRLVELYYSELKQLKPASSRYQALTEKIPGLTQEVQDLEKERLEVQLDLLKQKDASADAKTDVFTNAAMRREFSEAYQAWNRNDDELAWKKIEEIFRSPRWKQQATRAEWFRFYNLRFRVALGLGNLVSARVSYDEMKRLDKCSPDSAQAGFGLALVIFGNGGEANQKEAGEIFAAQCDPDHSSSNRLKRLYWKARFSGDAEAVKSYEELAQSVIPSYYAFLAHAQLRRPVELPTTLPAMPLEFSVGRSVHSLLVSAEDRLKINLRRDANLYLMKASYPLKNAFRPKDPDSVIAMLYLARLFRAAGNYLEAFKVYALLSVESVAIHNPILVDRKLYEEMYPMPFSAMIEASARAWKVDKEIVYSIMRQESAFNPAAVSTTDARGLMQLMPALARQLAQRWGYQKFSTDQSLFYAQHNIQLAVFHLRQLKETLPHLALIAAAYNAGVQRVVPWWKRYNHLPLDAFIELIPVNETRSYVKLVLRNYIYYRTLYSSGNAKTPSDFSDLLLKLPPYTRRAESAGRVSSAK